MVQVYFLFIAQYAVGLVEDGGGEDGAPSSHSGTQTGPSCGFYLFPGLTDISIHFANGEKSGALRMGGFYGHV